MRYSTSLLAELARAQGTALLDGTEQDIWVPHAQSAVITPPRRQEQMANPGAEAKRQSFLRHITRSLPALTAITFDTVCTFSRGLWRVFGSLDSLSDFTQPPSDSTFNALLLLDPAAFSQSLLVTVRVANVPQHRVGYWDFTFPEDGWAIQMQTDATAAAQLSQCRASVRGALLT